MVLQDQLSTLTSLSTIRKEVRARITRKGIEWNGLYYIANDPWLAEQITKIKKLGAFEMSS